MAMAELGDLNWWRQKRWGRGKAGRRLARTFHYAYHALQVAKQECTLWRWADSGGRLHDAFISQLEMDRAIAGAKAWCANNFRDNQYGHAVAAIAVRLPEKWAKSPTRMALALRAFEELCEDRVQHDRREREGWGERSEPSTIERLASELDLSVASVNLYRLDFFLFAAAIACDDDAWQEAMSGRDTETGEQVTEGEEMGRAEM